jgi:hypothetical protein
MDFSDTTDFRRILSLNVLKECDWLVVSAESLPLLLSTSGELRLANELKLMCIF